MKKSEGMLRHPAARPGASRAPLHPHQTRAPHTLTRATTLGRAARCAILRASSRSRARLAARPADRAARLRRAQKCRRCGAQRICASCQNGADRPIEWHARACGAHDASRAHGERVSAASASKAAMWVRCGRERQGRAAGRAARRGTEAQPAQSCSWGGARWDIGRSRRCRAAEGDRCAAGGALRTAWPRGRGGSWVGRRRQRGRCERSGELDDNDRGVRPRTLAVRTFDFAELLGGRPAGLRESY